MKKRSNDKKNTAYFGPGTDLTFRWNGISGPAGATFGASAMASVRLTDPDCLCGVLAAGSESAAPVPGTEEFEKSVRAMLEYRLDGILRVYTEDAAPVMNDFSDVCEYKFREYCKDIGIEAFFFSAGGWKTDEELPF